MGQRASPPLELSPCAVMGGCGGSRVALVKMERDGGEEEEIEFFSHCKNDLERHAHTRWAVP